MLNDMFDFANENLLTYHTAYAHTIGPVYISLHVGHKMLQFCVDLSGSEVKFVQLKMMVFLRSTES